MGQWTTEIRRSAQQLTEGIESEIAEALQPFDEVRRDLSEDIDDLKRYDWTGPKPSSGPGPEEALSDLEKLEKPEAPGESGETG